MGHFFPLPQGFTSGETGLRPVDTVTSWFMSQFADGGLMTTKPYCSSSTASLPSAWTN